MGRSSGVDNSIHYLLLQVKAGLFALFSPRKVRLHI